MSAVRRYAEGTTVTVESSCGEITGILAKHGCDRMAWTSAPEGDALQFVLEAKNFRFAIPRPTLEEVQAQAKKDGVYLARVRDWQPKIAAEWRRRWRARVLLIKAKLEFISAGDSTLDTEFLPYAVLKDGRTVGDLITGGELPLLLTSSKAQ